MASTLPNEPCSEQSSALSNLRSNGKLEEQWENNLESLQSQIVSILEAVDKDRVDVSVGQTAIRNDQAVVLAWNKNQSLKEGFTLQEKVEKEDDGVLLYLAIRYNPKGSSEKDSSLGGESSCSSSQLKELTHDENNNNAGANQDNEREEKEEIREEEIYPNSTHTCVQNPKTLKVTTAVDSEALTGTLSASSLSISSRPDILPILSVSDDPSGSEESLLSSHELQGRLRSAEGSKTKRKKSVHWRENLEDSPSTNLSLLPPSSSSSLESDDMSGSRIPRPQSSRRSSSDDSRRRRRDPPSTAHISQTHRVSLLRRQLSVDNRGPTPRRSRSLDDISSPMSSRRRNSVVRRPCRRRARSCSPECCWAQPLGVLTTKSDPASLRLDSNVVLPQTPNKIRRLRSKHSRFSKNIWFVGSTEKSFNSRCSKRFFIDDLDESSTHYYYFRSYPKVAPSSLPLSHSSSKSYTPSPSTKFE